MPQLLDLTFSPMLAEALGTCCTSLAKKQSGEMRSGQLHPPSAVSASHYSRGKRLCLLLGRFAVEHPSSLQSPPGCPWDLPPIFLSPRLMLPGEVWVWFHPGKTLHSWGQSGTHLAQPSAQSRVSGAGGILLSPWICAILTFLPCPGSLHSVGLALPVSTYKDEGIARCVL